MRRGLRGEEMGVFLITITSDEVKKLLLQGVGRMEEKLGVIRALLNEKQPTDEQLEAFDAAFQHMDVRERFTKYTRLRVERLSRGYENRLTIAKFIVDHVTEDHTYEIPAGAFTTDILSHLDLDFDR